MAHSDRILITGRSGQLSVALGAAAQDYGLIAHQVGRPVLDFERPGSIAEAFAATDPWLVVNAAAYTAVDAAEDEKEAAFRANRDGPAELARLCQVASIPLIHISSDYVFDGQKGAPYVESDPTSPQGVYGASKLEGEQAVLAECPRSIVLRTSWVYSPTGKNFVRTMLAVAQATDRLRVVGDQVGCPTSAPDLATLILEIASRIAADGWQDHYGGIYHAAGTGSATWHALANATFEEAARYGAARPTVEAIATNEWPTKAKRPADSRLECTKLADTFGLSMPPWRDSLARTIDALFTTTTASPHIVAG